MTHFSFKYTHYFVVHRPLPITTNSYKEMHIDWRQAAVVAKELHAIY